MHSRTSFFFLCELTGLSRCISVKAIVEVSYVEPLVSIYIALVSIYIARGIHQNN